MWHAFLPRYAACIFQGLGWIVAEPAEMVGMPFVLLMLLFPFTLRSRRLRDWLGADKLTYLYVIAFTIPGFTNQLEPWNDFYYFACSKGSTATTNPAWKAVIPDFVAVPTKVADALLFGGVKEIPWDAWIGPIFWYYIFIASFGLMGIAVANILRKHWIDIERIPFPHTLLAYQSLVQVQGGEQAKPGRKPFLLGLLVGIVVTAPIGMALIFPWFPDIYAWRTDTCGPGAHWLTGPLASLPLALHFNKHPLPFAIAYLLPLDVLFSCWLFELIYVIAVFVAFQMGYYTALPTTGSCGRLWCPPIAPHFGPPLRFNFIAGGGLLGFTLMSLYLSRGHILKTLKAAFRGLSSSESLEFEKGEPCSYRGTWLMFGIGFILLLVLLLFTGFHFEQAFALVFLSVILWIGQSRLFGLAGVHFESSGAVQWIPRAIWYPRLPEVQGTPSIDLVLGGHIWACPSGRHPCDGWGWSMYAPFSAYSMARLTGVNSRNVFKVLLVSLLVAQFVCLVAFVVGASYYGLTRLHGESFWDANLEWWATSPFAMTEEPPEEWVGHIVGGIFLLMAMTYIHARILWFPHPLGLIVGWMMSFSLFGWWLAFLVAWILKQLTLRLGGSRAYEEVGVPFAGGVVAGYAVIAFIISAAGVVRFFIPF
ncbi:hypothetical protein DRO58_02715 [Candidatus Bathyarchaeota archaeon]|nr:MAG: hypothetical protein DRO58_02715 [Candidatus Bathyarchaeota archaeon]